MSERAGTTHLRPTRWCVLISGRGSNLAAFLETTGSDGASPVRLVVSNDPEAAGLAKARRAGIPTETIFTKSAIEGKRPQLDWDTLDKTLEEHSIDAIFLLGFMRIVPASFIEKWSGRILNLHPSLLPKYPGLRSIEQAVKAEDDCGATVHEVVPEVDAGRILSSRVSVSKDVVVRYAAATNRPEVYFESIETLVHLDEQRLVKEIVETWRPTQQL